MARALISVSDKSGVADFARGLIARGFELVSTGGTAKVLERAGLRVTGVADVTGFPEMMDGRVKTLHPKVHGGILARRSRPDDLAAAAAQGITLIDLVVVNLYPFVTTAANPDTSFEGLIEEIDIGGPSLIRAAAKNFQDVLVVVSPADYQSVLEELGRPGGPSLEFRLKLARKAFAHTADYDAAIVSTLASVSTSESGFRRDTSTTPVGRVLSDRPFPSDRPVELPSSLTIDLRKVRDLRYGENPHQQAALYEGFGQHPGFRVLQGKELSYTNLLDLDAAVRIVISFTEPSAAMIKHTNPCGAAIGSSAVDAYVRARDADSLSAFGAIVGLNRTLDADTAHAIVSTRIDGVIAPSVDAAALEILARKPHMRVVVPERLVADAGYRSDQDLELRSIVGGVLVQACDRVTEALTEWPSGDLRVVTKRQPTTDEWKALRFAWLICAHVKSNTVVFTAADRTLAIGAGQMSRVDAVNLARMKAEAARVNLRGSVAASDAFFPFRDGLDAVAAAGATAVVQPGGSVKDEEVIDAANEHGLAMVFTGRRHFRH